MGAVTSVVTNNYFLKFVGLLVLLLCAAFVALTIMAEVQTVLDEVNASNPSQTSPNPCTDEDLAECLSDADPEKLAEINIVDGQYQVDVYNLVDGEWKLVTTIDDIATVEEVNSYLQARGFTITSP